MLRAATWPALVTFDIVARMWTLLGSTSRYRAHRLADSDAAQQARQAAEARLRAIAQTYASSTPLVLRLVVVEDGCTPGTVGWDLFTPVKPAYRVSCEMRLQAYYSSPLPSAETITRILAAGEQALSGIPFTHGDAHEDAPGEMTQAEHTLTWDQPGSRVPEPERPAGAHRFDREPPMMSVNGIRRRHGTVFALSLPPEHYYRVPR
ncbi:hypothetical protein GCM10010393_31390 [Streptomyces gobitricini]|uniref:Uncharacterized protein n=2 Tax=Streptomyces gobitricini TaxID=68211 RepID=A0ABN3M786_9ACTN